MFANLPGREGPRCAKIFRALAFTYLGPILGAAQGNHVSDRPIPTGALLILLSIITSCSSKLPEQVFDASGRWVSSAEQARQLGEDGALVLDARGQSAGDPDAYPPE